MESFDEIRTTRRHHCHLFHGNFSYAKRLPHKMCSSLLFYLSGYPVRHHSTMMLLPVISAGTGRPI